MKKKVKDLRAADHLIRKYHLEELNQNDLAIVHNIASSLAGKRLMEAGMKLGMASPTEQAKVGYLSALVEQNWLIINQLSRISQQLSQH